MKRNLCLILFILLGFGAVYGQWSGYMADEGTSTMDGGIGMTWIDDQAYYNISFQPDVSIGKLGVGLNLSLLYNVDTGHIRSEDWDSGYDYARIIRYVRWGHKGDGFYTRIGALDAARIGHGFILGYYNNQINYDERKIGLSLDMDFGLFGIETMTSNLGRLEVLGLRGYVRPMNKKEIPVLRNLAFGASYVTDVDPDGSRDSKDGVAFMGIDVELPLIKSDILKMTLFADHAFVVDPVSQAEMMQTLYSKVNGVAIPAIEIQNSYSTDKKGSGQSVGLLTDFSALFDLLNLSVGIERRWLGKGFVPNYYGPMYEVQRYCNVGDLLDYYDALGADASMIPPELLNNNALLGSLINKKTLMPLISEKQQGWFAGLHMNFLKIVQVMGSFEMLDDVKNSGQLHFGAGLAQEIPLISLEASYDKIGIETFKDIRTLDNRSVARVGLGYKIKPFLLLYMDYIWTFQWDEENGMYKPQERIQPRLAFRMPFNL
ncbi:hypothetical protein HQ585_00265 [candidate division KSB1 bacterium]|nr:hypothetical protein [candidate division KSB1 bacterium]